MTASLKCIWNENTSAKRSVEEATKGLCDQTGKEKHFSFSSDILDTLGSRNEGKTCNIRLHIASLWLSLSCKTDVWKKLPECKRKTTHFQLEFPATLIHYLHFQISTCRLFSMQALTQQKLSVNTDQTNSFSFKSLCTTWQWLNTGALEWVPIFLTITVPLSPNSPPSICRKLFRAGTAYSVSIQHL